MTTHEDNWELTAFRHHRHDVMNFLQVVRAYVQLGRTEGAIEAVDRLAEWLKSLSLWQSKVQQEDACLVWHAATCPQVWLTEAPRVCLNDLQRDQLRAIWSRLNTLAQSLGIRAFQVRWEEVVKEGTDTLQVLSIEALAPVPENWKSIFRDTFGDDWPTMFEIHLHSEQ